MSSAKFRNPLKIKFAILKKAAELQKQDLAKSKEESDNYKIPGQNF